MKLIGKYLPTLLRTKEKRTESIVIIKIELTLSRKQTFIQIFTTKTNYVD